MDITERTKVQSQANQEEIKRNRTMENKNQSYEGHQLLSKNQTEKQRSGLAGTAFQRGSCHGRISKCQRYRLLREPANVYKINAIQVFAMGEDTHSGLG
jgi:hypothetical protein